MTLSKRNTVYQYLSASVLSELLTRGQHCHHQPSTTCPHIEQALT